MSVSWNTGSDFPDVIDGVQSVTLHRLSGGAPLTVDGALRRRGVVREYPGGGAATEEVRWHLPVTVIEESPAIGDRLVDGGLQTWTIVEVHYEGSGRWLCIGRNLTLIHGLSELIAIERAVWTKDAAGAAATWHPWQSALAARIVPRDARVSSDAGRMHMLATHQVLLAVAAEVDQDCRIVGADGAIYRILVVRPAEQLDALNVLDVLLEKSA